MSYNVWNPRGEQTLPPLLSGKWLNHLTFLFYFVFFIYRLEHGVRFRIRSCISCTRNANPDPLGFKCFSSVEPGLDFFLTD